MHWALDSRVSGDIFRLICLTSSLTVTAGAWLSSSNLLSDVVRLLQAGACVSPTATGGDIY